MPILNPFRRLRWAAFVALGLFAVTTRLCWAEDAPLEPSARASQLLNEAGQLGDLIAKSRDGERLAEQALHRADQALQLSRQEQDATAEAIATEARNVSQQTLSNARAQRQANEKRLREIEVLLGRGDDTKGAAQVLDIKGEVYVKTKLGYVKIGPNFELRRGEEVRTGKNGELMLRVDDDGSKIHLRPNSAFVRLDKEDAEFDLSIGSIKAEIVRLNRRQRYAVRTPTAAVGVRGTVFEVVTMNDSTETRVYAGQVDVMPVGAKEPVLLGAGQRVIVMRGGRVIGPQPLNISERNTTTTFLALERR